MWNDGKTTDSYEFPTRINTDDLDVSGLPAQTKTRTKTTANELIPLRMRLVKLMLILNKD